MNLRWTFLIALTVFAVTLAIVIGKRLSGEDMIEVESSNSIR